MYNCLCVFNQFNHNFDISFVCFSIISHWGNIIIVLSNSDGNLHIYLCVSQWHEFMVTCFGINITCIHICKIYRIKHIVFFDHFKHIKIYPFGPLIYYATCTLTKLKSESCCQRGVRKLRAEDRLLLVSVFVSPEPNSLPVMIKK